VIKLAEGASEHTHQVALFSWCAVAALHGFVVADKWADGMPIGDAKALHGSNAVPELRWYHAIPNGGARGDDAKSRAIRGGQLKAEGVKVGVSDTFLPVKRGIWSGLYIELKKPGKGSKVSEEQSEFGEFVKAQGFGFIVCYGWKEAKETLIMYLQT